MEAQWNPLNPCAALGQTILAGCVHKKHVNLRTTRNRKRPQPQGAYARALIQTRHTSPQTGLVLAGRFSTTFFDYGVNQKHVNLRTTRKRKRRLPPGTYARALGQTRHTSTQTGGGACPKVFDHFHDYGVNKKTRQFENCQKQKKTSASRYLRSRSNTNTPYKSLKWISACRKVFGHS